jgi:hypothetical protein
MCDSSSLRSLLPCLALDPLPTALPPTLAVLARIIAAIRNLLHRRTLMMNRSRLSTSLRQLILDCHTEVLRLACRREV